MYNEDDADNDDCLNTLTRHNFTVANSGSHVPGSFKSSLKFLTEKVFHKFISKSKVQ